MWMGCPRKKTHKFLLKVTKNRIFYTRNLTFPLNPVQLPSHPHRLQPAGLPPAPLSPSTHAGCCLFLWCARVCFLSPFSHGAASAPLFLLSTCLILTLQLNINCNWKITIKKSYASRFSFTVSETTSLNPWSQLELHSSSSPPSTPPSCL